MKNLRNNFYTHIKGQNTYESLFRQQKVNDEIHKHTCSKPTLKFFQRTFWIHNQQRVFHRFTLKYVLQKKRLKRV